MGENRAAPRRRDAGHERDGSRGDPAAVLSTKTASGGRARPRCGRGGGAQTGGPGAGKGARLVRPARVMRAPTVSATAWRAAAGVAGTVAKSLPILAAMKLKHALIAGSILLLG